MPTKPQAPRPEKAEPKAVVTPPVPAAASASAADGMAEGRELARSYLVNCVRLNAAIAFTAASEASLHNRYLCAKEIREIAGVIPPMVPDAPLPDGHTDGREPS